MLDYLYTLISQDDFEIIRSTLKNNEKLEDKEVRIEYQGHNLNTKQGIKFSFSYRFQYDHSSIRREFLKQGIKKYASDNNYTVIEAKENCSQFYLVTYSLLIKII